MDAARTITGFGGVAAARELRRRGIGRRELERALESRTVFRVRQGWYARPGLDPELVGCTRVGGRATCITALRSWGAWTPPGDDRLHVAVLANANGLRAPDDRRARMRPDSVRVHWDARGGRSRLRVDPGDAIRDLAHCTEPVLFAATVDSLLRARPDLARAWDSAASRLPRRLRRIVTALDGVCESGVESVFWLRLGLAIPSAPLRRQVRIGGIGRVDFLIGDRLVVEIDGREFHDDRDAFERDRRRDAALSRLGYRVLRFSYRQVMYDWAVVEAAVLAAMIRGDTS